MGYASNGMSAAGDPGDPPDLPAGASGPRRPAGARPRPRRRQERSGAARSAILAAALEEFSGVGFEGASTRRIAEGAGVSLPLIRHHFGNKEDLWKATAAEVYGAFLERLGERRKGLEGVADRVLLRLLLREYILFFARVPQFARFLIQVNHGPPELLEWLVARFVPPAGGWYNDLLRRAQSEGYFPRGDLFLLRFLFLGAATSVFVFGPTISRLSGLDPADESVIEKQVDLVLHLFVGPKAMGPPRRGLL